MAEEATDLYELATGALRLPDLGAAIGLLSRQATRLPGVLTFSLVAVEHGEPRLAGGDAVPADVLRRAGWSFQHSTPVGGSIGAKGLGLVKVSTPGELARAEFKARRKIRDRRYVYVPRRHQREEVADVWRAIHPRETVAAEVDHALLPPVAIDRVRRHNVGGQVVLHMVSARQLRDAVAREEEESA